MLKLYEDGADVRGYADRLVRLVEKKFPATNFKWQRFLSEWEINFVEDICQKANLDEMWLPTTNQLLHMFLIIGKLEYRLSDIEKYYSDDLAHRRKTIAIKTGRYL